MCQLQDVECQQTFLPSGDALERRQGIVKVWSDSIIGDVLEQNG